MRYLTEVLLLGCILSCRHRISSLRSVKTRPVHWMMELKEEKASQSQSDAGRIKTSQVATWLRGGRQQIV